ncbi:hypothetical protein M9458_048120, partial [Cirrhinus mrigala]
RGIALSKTAPRTLCSSQTIHTTRTAASARFSKLDRHTCAASLATYIEWVLVSRNSPLTVDFAEDNTSPTLDPEPSQPSPRFTKHEPEPTADGEPEPSATYEPSPKGATVLRIAPEPEPITSDQVREPATSHATVEVTVEREGAEGSPAHCTIAKGERKLDRGLWYFEQDLIDFNEDISADMPPLIPPSSELSTVN